MTSRTLTLQDAPAAHAQAALDGINADPASFNMGSWLGHRDDGRSPLYRHFALKPDANPASCNSTLCAAGWVAHNAGYFLLRSRTGDTYARTQLSPLPLSISGIAGNLLGLEDEQAFDLFHATAPEAKYALGLIARGVPTDWDADDAGEFYEWLDRHGYPGPAENE